MYFKGPRVWGTLLNVVRPGGCFVLVNMACKIRVEVLHATLTINLKRTRKATPLCYATLHNKVFKVLWCVLSNTRIHPVSLDLLLLTMLSFFVEERLNWDWSFLYYVVRAMYSSMCHVRSSPFRNVLIFPCIIKDKCVLVFTASFALEAWFLKVPKWKAR